VLLTLVIAYLLVTIAIGLVAAKRVKSSADFAIAGRHLPLVMIVTTTFATWFGSETVLGIPAKFVNSGLNGVVEDPFGAGSCLILVGLFFASKLYRMNLLTISDYYRERYGRAVEVICSVIKIIVLYLELLLQSTISSPFLISSRVIVLMSMPFKIEQSCGFVTTSFDL
jgi:Na+/proline symporter